MKPQHIPSKLEQDLERLLTTLLSNSEGKMNTIQQALFHTAATVYEIASGQSFTQRVLIPKAIKFYKEKSLLVKGINRYLQWRDSAFL
ncbi:hypothetical protein [Robertmurraya sp.]|uniref:hypothetical protein n=1 Tax=Robertmurraya sp. TaxID=2837525 RepID=UPI003703A8CD